MNHKERLFNHSRGCSVSLDPSGSKVQGQVKQMSEQKKRELRSQDWFGRQDKMGFYYRSFLKNSGFPQDQYDGRPVIGICNTWSELTPCNSHFRTIAEHV